MALTEVPDVPMMDLRTALGDHLEYVEQESLDSVSLTAEQLLLPFLFLNRRRVAQVRVWSRAHRFAAISGRAMIER